MKEFGKGLYRHLLNEFRVDQCRREERNIILTWPNLVTLIGVILAIFYYFQFSYDFWPNLIPATFILVGASDLVDGYLAQRLNQCSKIGKIIDGFRDRLLALFLCLNFAQAGEYSLVATLPLGVLVLSEICIAMMNASYFRKGTFNVHPISKTRQFLHIAFGLGFLVQNYWDWNIGGVHLPIWFFIWAMALTSIVFVVFHTKKYNECDMA